MQDEDKVICSQFRDVGFFSCIFSFDLQSNLCKDLSGSSAAKRIRKCLITPTWGGFSWYCFCHSFELIASPTCISRATFLLPMLVAWLEIESGTWCSLTSPSYLFPVHQFKSHTYIPLLPSRGESFKLALLFTISFSFI